MEEDACLRHEVIARLMTRHGLSFKQADVAWEQYQLRLRALRNKAEGVAESVESN